MVAIIERLIRQIKGDPTGCKREQKLHGAEWEQTANHI
jgi:hypothetical protein